MIEKFKTIIINVVNTWNKYMCDRIKILQIDQNPQKNRICDISILI
jgi:hypothetical protein